MGMERAGHKCLGYVEIDKFARKSYEAIHNTKGEWTAHDITTVTDDDLRLLRGQVDVICGGFPCQAFSIAGKRLGFAETRGTLFFEIARFAKEIQPQYLFLENVKGLLNHDSGNTFRTILSTLDELGYDAEWQICNSKDYGVAQNRERVFIIGHLRGRSRREVFPIRRSYETAGVQRVGNINPSGNGMNGNVYSFGGLAPTLTTNKGEGPKVVVKGMLDIKGKDQIRRVYGTDGISPCLTTMQGGGQEPKIVTCVNPRQTNGIQTRQQDRVYIPDGNMVALSAQLGGRYNIVQPVLTPDRADKRQNGRRMKEPGDPMFTLTAQDKHGIYDGFRIRKLTPRECWRLQGFPDWAFDRAQEVNSDSQLYKQSGNSVTVPVIYEIAKRLV